MRLSGAMRSPGSCQITSRLLTSQRLGCDPPPHKVIETPCLEQGKAMRCSLNGTVCLQVSKPVTSGPLLLHWRQSHLCTLLSVCLQVSKPLTSGPLLLHWRQSHPRTPCLACPA